MEVTVGLVPAHDAPQTHRYTVHFPAHFPRETDPHYAAFEEYHRRTAAAAKCHIGSRIGFGSCAGGLELHHAHIEFALANGIDLAAIQIDFPDLTDDAAVQRWIESEANFRWLCTFHHRGHSGAHVASHADWEASQYVKGLMT